MKIFKYIIFALISLFLSLSNKALAEINFTFSPIKYEITAQTGSTVTRTASFTNHTNTGAFVETGKSDFVAKDDFGSPGFVRKSEIVFDDQIMSEWIDISVDSFFINPGETVDVDFDINIPSDAEPGGHYAAVFFKPDTTTSGADIAISVDYGVLVLLEVSGEIDIEGEVEDDEISISNGGGGGGVVGTNRKDGKGGSWLVKDKCPLGDLTKSRYDGKCFDNPFKQESEEDIDSEKENEQDNQEEEKDNLDEDFNIKFEIPFSNKGNTHIKPKGKITITDSKGNKIGGIGKEYITSDNGVIIGEKIVDYLPINDTKGNVLPGTKRIFGPEWKGFPYKGIDDKGNFAIKYKTPGKYYTEKNISDRNFLMFWERVVEKRKKEKMLANIELEYVDENGDIIEFNSAKEFDIEYSQEEIGLNPYVIIPFGIAILTFIFFKIIFGFKRKKCTNKKCRKKIKRNIKRCNHCGKKQK